MHSLVPPSSLIIPLGVAGMDMGIHIIDNSKTPAVLVTNLIGDVERSIQTFNC